MKQTYSGHYEPRDKATNNWYHLRVYEERGVLPVVVASACPHGRDRRLRHTADLATRVVWHLIPYARDGFRWFDELGGGKKGQGGRYVEVTFSRRDLSGGLFLIDPVRTATERAHVEALIGTPLQPVTCSPDMSPQRSDDPLDDPWYLPPDTPIPITFTLDNGRDVKAIPKVERARRFRLLEERALTRRQDLLGY